MKTINTQFQHSTVEDLNKNYLSETRESYKLKTLDILNNSNINFSNFIDEQSLATDISRLGGLKSGSMLDEQLTMLGLHKQVNKFETRKSTNITSFTGAPNLTTKLGGPFNNVA